jgi:dTDP-4-dehydrorhamnose 3,5-epimerase|tara:strand:- start:12556 stop:13059 length:504 start_codon:yes stop_codon:yes gene_type:complete
MFKYKESSSITLPEVKVYVPEPHHEFRGEMWTFWEQSMDTPTEKISKFTRSRKNVLRGLHGDDVTWKHISCVWGEIYLVVVDFREESENYLEYDTFLISDRNHKSVLVPPGFLNGHLCLSDECLFHYTQSYPDDYVDWKDQISVKWNDPMLKIDWPVTNPILSRRDS